MKKCIRKITAFILMLCVVITSSGLQTIKLMANTGSHIYEYDGYRILYNLVNEWDGGIQVDVTITNTSDESIKNWGVKLSIPGQIQSIWNVTIKDVAEGIYILSNNGYNSEILAGQSVNFGYVLSGDKFSVPEKISLTQEKREVANGYEIQYVLTNDWGTGFQGIMRIINKKDEPIENWQLDFESNVVLNNVWNAQWKEQDGKYTLTANNWLKDIQVGDAIEIGFTGDKSENTEVVFDNFYMTEIVICPKMGENLENESTESVSEEQESTEAENETNESTEQESTETETQPTTEATTEEWTEDVSECETETQSEPETNQCTEPVTEDIVIDYKKDSDGDKLPDYLEESYGCDKNNPDTDGDGLPDGYEVYYLGTDPSKPDSNDNGVVDGDEDSDEDGVNNLYEYENGMSPLSSDTDMDGLSDYDEIYVYRTNPLKKDTDDDGITDGDEVRLGLNPTDVDTNGDGKPDGEEKIYQDKELIFKDDNNEGALTKVVVSMECNGCIDSNTEIKDMTGLDILSSDVVGRIGSPIDITTSASFDTAEIKFYYDPQKLGDTNPENLAVMWYDEANNTFVVLEDSVVDTINNCVSYTTTHFSEYLVIDIEMWYNLWKDAPDYRENGNGNTDLICVMDYTSEAPDNTYTKAKKIILYLINNLNFSKDTEKVNDRMAVLSYPYDNQEICLLESKKLLIDELNKAKPAQKKNEIDRIDILKDGEFQSQYLYDGFDWDNYERYVYGRVYANNYEKILNTGKYSLAYTADFARLRYKDGCICTGESSEYVGPSEMTIQLKKRLENCIRLGASINITGQYVTSGSAAEVILHHFAGNQGIYSSFDVLNIAQVTNGFIEKVIDIDNKELDCVNFISIYNAYCKTQIKNIWIEGYFKESKAEQGINAALDIFENTEDSGNQKRIVLISGIDTNIENETMERAKRLGVTIDSVYIGGMKNEKEYNMYESSDITGGNKYIYREYMLEDLYYYIKSGASFTLADSDKDGIPDVYEKVGLYLQNGKVIKTEPYVADSDEDGISDGEELGITGNMSLSQMLIVKVQGRDKETISKYCFRCISYPDKEDSDEDGYLDGINNDYVNNTKYSDEADLTPLKSSVIITELPGNIDGKYVPVLYEGNEVTDNIDGYKRYSSDPNYGGNQMWLYDKSSEIPKKNENINVLKKYIMSLSDGEYTNFCLEQGGCGITTLTDYLLYLEYFNKEFDTRINDAIKKDAQGNKYISYYDYISYYVDEALRIPFIYKNRIDIFRYEDCWGVDIIRVLMQLNSKVNYWYNEDPNRIFSFVYYKMAEENINSYIKNQIEINIPVILLTQIDGKIRFYKYNNNCFLNKDNQIKEEDSLYHFMTITGVQNDIQKGEIYYVISSWGEKYLVEAKNIIEKEQSSVLPSGVFLNHMEVIWN